MQQQPHKIFYVSTHGNTSYFDSDFSNVQTSQLIPATLQQTIPLRLYDWRYALVSLLKMIYLYRETKPWYINTHWAKTLKTSGQGAADDIIKPAISNPCQATRCSPRWGKYSLQSAPVISEALSELVRVMIIELHFSGELTVWNNIVLKREGGSQRKPS